MLNTVQFFFEKKLCFGYYFSAMSLYTRSPAAYRALKDFKLFALPHENTLKSFMSVNSHKPGVNSEYLFEQHKLYQQHRERILDTGCQAPRGYGALIFDEVKVNIDFKTSCSY